MLVLHRREPARNMARFYVLSVEDALFGGKALLRSWGRIGTRGREVRHLYPSEALAQQAMDDWLRRKQKRGYRFSESELSADNHLRG